MCVLTRYKKSWKWLAPRSTHNLWCRNFTMKELYLKKWSNTCWSRRILERSVDSDWPSDFNSQPRPLNLKEWAVTGSFYITQLSVTVEGGFHPLNQMIAGSGVGGGGETASVAVLLLSEAQLEFETCSTYGEGQKCPGPYADFESIRRQWSLFSDLSVFHLVWAVIKKPNPRWEYRSRSSLDEWEVYQEQIEPPPNWCLDLFPFVSGRKSKASQLTFWGQFCFLSLAWILLRQKHV